MKRIKIVLFILLVVFIFSSCYDPGIAFKRYPWYKADTWYCEEIDMTIQFEFDEDGSIQGGTLAQLTVDNVIHTVSVAFRSNIIAFGIQKGDADSYKTCMDGTWYYRNGNLVVEVHSESILNGKYTELIFSPRLEK